MKSYRAEKTMTTQTQLNDFVITRLAHLSNSARRAQFISPSYEKAINDRYNLLYSLWNKN